MQLYSDNPIMMNYDFVVNFQDEFADGDGVAREAYSIFMDQLLLKAFEGKTEFTPIIQPEFGDDEFKVVGKIFRHFFINFFYQISYPNNKGLKMYFVETVVIQP